MCKGEVWAFSFQRTAGATGSSLGLGLEFPSGMVSQEVLAARTQKPLLTAAPVPTLSVRGS